MIALEDIKIRLSKIELFLIWPNTSYYSQNKLFTYYVIKSFWWFSCFDFVVEYYYV